MTNQQIEKLESKIREWKEKHGTSLAELLAYDYIAMHAPKTTILKAQIIIENILDKITHEELNKIYWAKKKGE